MSVPARAGTYMIQSFDKVGIPSAGFASAVVLPAQLQQFGTTLTATEHSAGFTGTKSGCQVVGGNLRITNTAANPQFADTDVVFFIGVTQDNPSGSPTWSAYQPFKAGQFSGRAFRFKVELKSTSVGVTPSVDELFAQVEYN